MILKRFASLIFVFFIAISLFGMMYNLGMEKGTQGKMSGCFFARTSVCTMTPTEHIAAWQSMFAALPASADVALLFLLLSFVFAVFIIGSLFLRKKTDLIGIRHRLYAKNSLAFVFARPLQEAFSNGIIHSKAF